MKVSLSIFAIGLMLSACAAPGPATSAPQATSSRPPAPSPAAIGTLTFTDTACTLDVTASPVRPGLLSLSVVNQTSSLIAADMSRIGEGHTYDEFTRDIETARKAAEAGEAVVHRPSYLLDFGPIQLGAGGSAPLISSGLPGTYAIVCLRMYDKLGEIRPFAFAGPLEVR